MAKTKSTAAQIDQYYATLDEFAQQNALHEGSVSIAFQTLLADTARSHHWTLIPQLSDKTAGKSIRPDGTFGRINRCLLNSDHRGIDRLRNQFGDDTSVAIFVEPFIAKQRG